MLDVTAHNVSNVNTVGYRSGRVDFEDLAYAGLVELDRGAPLRGAATGGIESAPVHAARGHGVRPEGVSLSEESGPMSRTDVPTDLAVEGEGYFVLVDGAGEPAGYTRDGAFRVDADGALVHGSGAFLADGAGEVLRVPIDEEVNTLLVDADGAVSVVGPGDATEALGELALMVPGDGERLVRGGANTHFLVDEAGAFVEGALRAPGEDSGVILQGFLEGSNADLAWEMSRMILAQRAFQLNARSLQTADDMFEMANHMRR